jgi:hypothetical protein
LTPTKGGICLPRNETISFPPLPAPSLTAPLLCDFYLSVDEPKIQDFTVYRPNIQASNVKDFVLVEVKWFATDALSLLTPLGRKGNIGGIRRGKRQGNW